MILPRVFDLKGMADKLGPHPRYSPFKRAVRAVAMAQSCLSDLQRSLSYLEALDRSLGLGEVEDDSPEALARSSFMLSSVLLYARATHTNGKDGQRGAIQISHHLSPEQLEDHKALLVTRNRAVAHVYSSEEVDDAVWSTGCVIAVEIPEGLLPGCATRSLQLAATTLKRLDRALPVAIDIVCTRSIDRIAKLSEAVNEASIPMEVFEKHGIDPVALFGSAEAAAKALAAVGSGRGTSIYVNFNGRGDWPAR